MIGFLAGLVLGAGGVGFVWWKWGAKATAVAQTVQADVAKVESIAKPK